jgi:uncharacterized protein YfaS (alpha-2-macroglobulin family)
MQAYRLYTLALAGKPEMGAMNRMKERGSTSLAAKWRLAAAYALAGQQETARSMINNQVTSVAPYTSMSGTYGSNYRDEAMIIENDYEHEINNWESHVDSIYSLDQQQRTIYLGTFNRILHPSIRLGYMIAPPYLIPNLKALQMHSCSACCNSWSCNGLS